MGYHFTPVGEPTERCGYRIQPVEDVPMMLEGVRIKGPDWFAVPRPEEWASLARLPDDEFSMHMIALGLEAALGVPVTVTSPTGGVIHSG